MIRLAGATAAAVALLNGLVVVGYGRAPAIRQPEPALQKAIDNLGSFDFPTRREAARTVRRADAGKAVPALTLAAESHKDQYVRYRALVLLTAFGDAAAISRTARELIADKNDRLRAVVYAWFEHNPDRQIVQALLDAVPSEPSPFVRPALLRALAAQPEDPRVKDLLTRFVIQGEDVFRGATIVALGDYRRMYATKAIIEVAKLDGPLQADAIAALGRMKDSSAAPALAEIRRQASPEIVPLIVADECLLGFDCQPREAFLATSVRQDAKNAARALGSLALGGRPSAVATILDAGIAAHGDARETAAIEIGIIALRDPAMLVDTLGTRPDHRPALDLLGEAFELLSSEDFLLERFYMSVRHRYWAAPESSPQRKLLDDIIQKLGF